MTLEIGFGAGTITPELPVVLAGFGERKGEVHEVRHDLEAHAVVVRSGSTTLCLLVLDLLMLAPDHADPVRAAVGAALGVPAAQVLTSCTHTHSGPSAAFKAKRAGWPCPPGYLDILTEGAVAAATAALASLEPASLAYARGDLPDGLSINRRQLPYSPQYSVLEATRPDGSLIGTIANVGIHPVALAPTCRAVSGDWVTTFRERLTASTGAPGVLLPGALGDVNPGRDPHTDAAAGGNWEYAEELGTDVATAVRDLLQDAKPVGDEATVVARREVVLRPALTLASVLTGNTLKPVEVELLEWSLGGVRLVSIPGEGFHALGRAIERARGDQAMLAGLAPVWHGYLPAPFRSGYEETMSFGRRFVKPVRDLLVQPPTGSVQ